MDGHEARREGVHRWGTRARDEQRDDHREELAEPAEGREHGVDEPADVAAVFEARVPGRDERRAGCKDRAEEVDGDLCNAVSDESSRAQ